jgi:hypothetical protein
MNDYKIYIITFYAQNVNLPALHMYLNDSVDILGYWNHIPLVYCVKSRLPATMVRDRLRPFLPDPMMVAEINPANMNGYMFSADLWNWFFQPPPEKKPTLPSGLLRGLSGPGGPFGPLALGSPKK